MKQTVLTIITEIDPKKIEQLKGILTQIQADLYNNQYLPFSKISLVHFASFVIVDQKGSNSLLVFENNFDGDLSDYLDQLLSVAGAGIDQIYQCCIGYQPQELKSFLTAHVVLPNAYHIGNVGRAAKDVGNNRELRKRLQDYLDQFFNLSKPAKLSETELRKNIQAYTKNDIAPDLSSVLPPHQTLSERVMPWVWLILLGLVLIVLGIRLEQAIGPVDVKYVF